MNEYEMELVDRFAALLEENAQLRMRFELLENTVRAEEIRDALTKERDKNETWVRFDYTGRIDTETINTIMGWKRSRKAEEIIERLRKEAKDGESV